jgi:hypothetical protein
MDIRVAEMTESCLAGENTFEEKLQGGDKGYGRV